MTNATASEVNEVLQVVSPASDIAEVAGAVVSTIAAPTPAVVAEDLLLAGKIASDLKTSLQGKPVSLWTIVKALFEG